MSVVLKKSKKKTAPGYFVEIFGMRLSILEKIDHIIQTVALKGPIMSIPCRKYRKNEPKKLLIFIVFPQR